MGKDIKASKAKKQDIIDGSFDWKAIKKNVEREMLGGYQCGESSTVLYAEEINKEGK